MVSLKRLGPGSYETRDGRFAVEKSDERTLFPHHGWSEVAWVLMDPKTNETIKDFPSLALLKTYLDNLDKGCHAARTGEGYWTCDVPGGCADCRALAREVEDTAQLTEWKEA